MFIKIQNGALVNMDLVSVLFKAEYMEGKFEEEDKSTYYIKANVLNMPEPAIVKIYTNKEERDQAYSKLAHVLDTVNL